MHGLIDLDNIPPHRPRPIRYSLTLIGLCFGLSFVVHAAVVLGMWLSPVHPASAWSQSAKSTQQNERHVVRVTMMLSASNFAPAQAQPELPSDQPVEPVPPVPVAVPELSQGPADAPPSTQPTTAKPPAPDEPIVESPQVEQPSQPIALDLPATERIDAPLPPLSEASEPEATAQPETTQTPTEVSKPTAQAPADEPTQPTEQANKPSRATSSEPTAEQAEPTTPTPSEPKEPATETKDQPEPPTEPATETTEASEPTDEQPEAPDTDANDPASVVYDEDSVDQPITFEDKTRPTRSMISQRLCETGTVRIRIEVDSDGKLINHEVLDDAGHPRLLKAAESALQDSTFRPAMRGDRAVRSTRIIEYRF